MNKKTQLPLILLSTLLATASASAQDAQPSNVPADIRAMIEQSQANSGFDSMARMQVDVQFGEFLASLGTQPAKRDAVEQALGRVISERLELSNQVATGAGNVAALETLSSYAYLRGQLAPLLDNSELARLDEEQGAIAQRNLRRNYGEQLTQAAPDLTESNREMVLDNLVEAMLFRRDEAQARNQLAPDEIVNQQIMSLGEARNVILEQLSGSELEQVNAFLNQLRSNLFLNQSMYNSVQ